MFQESKTQVGNDKLVVKFASCINADGGYVTVDGNTIDVSRNNFETLFTQIRYGKKPGFITYLGCSRNHSYYEVEVTEQDWETLNIKSMENREGKTMTELTFEYKDISIPVEILETSKGNKYVAVDYKVWNSVTKDMTEEKYGDIFMSLHAWFKDNEIFVDEYHKDNLRNQNAPIYWLLDDNDDE